MKCTRIKTLEGKAHPRYDWFYSDCDKPVAGIINTTWSLTSLKIGINILKQMDM